MTEHRNSEHRTTIHPQDRSYGVGSAKDSAAIALTGRTAYQEEYQHDRGPDLDESLDGIESAHEF